MNKKIWYPLWTLLAVSAGIILCSILLVGAFTSSQMDGAFLLEYAGVLSGFRLAWPLCRFLFLAYLYVLAYKALRQYLSKERKNEEGP